jgi:hypothetical protein
MFSRATTHSRRIFAFVKRANWFAVASSVLAWGALGAQPLACLAFSQAYPIAAVDQATYDFGEVYEGEHIAHTFTVRNTGSVPLELHDPAVKAENQAGDQSALVASDFGAEGGIARLAGQAALSQVSFTGHTGAAMALRPLLAVRGRPAAPA